MMYEPTEEEAVAKTLVFWDINSCPVPIGCDPGRVGTCIKRFLKKHGYSGPVTITAIGVLTDVPLDILRSVYSNGISFYIRPRRVTGTMNLVCNTLLSYISPANIMVISHPIMSRTFDTARRRGFNPLQPYPYTSLLDFFLEDLSGALKDVMCSENVEPPSWICNRCLGDTAFQDFEKLTKHLSGIEHHQMLRDYAAPPGKNGKAEVQKIVVENTKTTIVAHVEMDGKLVEVRIVDKIVGVDVDVNKEIVDKKEIVDFDVDVDVDVDLEVNKKEIVDVDVDVGVDLEVNKKEILDVDEKKKRPHGVFVGSVFISL